MILLCLLLTTYAADDIHSVEDGAEEVVLGPAVWMTPSRFKSYVVSSRTLPSCMEALGESTEKLVAANERVAKVRDIAEDGLDASLKDVQELQLQVSELSMQLAEERAKSGRIRYQRNTAWAVTGGFLAASAGAIAVALR